MKSQFLWQLLLLVDASVVDAQGEVQFFARADPSVCEYNGVKSKCDAVGDKDGMCAYAPDVNMVWCCDPNDPQCWGWRQTCEGSQGNAQQLLCGTGTKTWCCNKQYEDCVTTAMNLCVPKLFENPVKDGPLQPSAAPFTTTSTIDDFTPAPSPPSTSKTTSSEKPTTTESESESEETSTSSSTRTTSTPTPKSTSTGTSKSSTTSSTSSTSSTSRTLSPTSSTNSTRSSSSSRSSSTSSTSRSSSSSHSSSSSTDSAEGTSTDSPRETNTGELGQNDNEDDTSSPSISTETSGVPQISSSSSSSSSSSGGLSAGGAAGVAIAAVLGLLAIIGGVFVLGKKYGKKEAASPETPPLMAKPGSGMQEYYSQTPPARRSRPDFEMA